MRTLPLASPQTQVDFTVAQVNAAGAIVAPAAANADGSVAIAGADGTTKASTGNAVPVKAASYTQLGYQQITAATLASSTAMTVPATTTTAIIQNNTTQPARFRPDGSTTAPTTTTGQRLLAAGTLTLDIGNAGLTSTRFILEAAGTGNFDITYYA